MGNVTGKTEEHQTMQLFNVRKLRITATCMGHATIAQAIVIGVHQDTMQPWQTEWEDQIHFANDDGRRN